jgi:hypothetical protein
MLVFGLLVSSFCLYLTDRKQLSIEIAIRKKQTKACKFATVQSLVCALNLPPPPSQRFNFEFIKNGRLCLRFFSRRNP